jgi:nitrite reductase (NO-forming)
MYNADSPRPPLSLRLHWRTWAAGLVASVSIALVTLVGGALPAEVERQAALRPLPATGSAFASSAPIVAAPIVAAPRAAAMPLPQGLTRLPQPQMMPPLGPGEPSLVHFDLETREVTALLADGVGYHFWTFNGTVPGPMLRVRQGDTVEIALSNASDSLNTHSINLHAATGPGGGASLSQIGPSGKSTFRFEALHPGVYVYHCMTPVVGNHVANGMYGMVVVEPPGGLPPVEREFYLMQGDFYPQGGYNEPGVQTFDLQKLLHEQPEYVVFNGSVGSLAGETALRANVGDRVRIFFGVGGPNLDSSFHVVGESFDRVWPEGAEEPLTNVQTTLVPPGGATMVELTMDVPGAYMIEDHHITRLEKGAWAHFNVEGADQPAIFAAVP